MKLNIEELAREAGAGYGAITEEIMERFARLIVKRCAQECVGLIESDHLTAYKHGCNDSAAAILNLLED